MMRRYVQVVLCLVVIASFFAARADATNRSLELQRDVGSAAQELSVDVSRARRRSKKKRDPSIVRNVDPSGFDWYSPWASGLTLRQIPTVIDKCCGTLVVYAVAPTGVTSMRNFNFYLLAMISAYSAEVVMPKHYYHCFVTNGPLQKRTIKLLAELKALVPQHHAFNMLNTSSAFEGQSYRFSRQVGYAIGKIDMKSFSSFVVLNSKTVGPFFAPYWNPEVMPIWTDAYTGLLSDDVRVVGRVLSCPAPEEKVILSAERHVPYFDGPIAMDREGLRLAMGTSFEVFKGKFVFAVLSAGHNVEALHGQPRGTDWRPALKHPLVSGICTTEIARFINHPFESLFVNRNKKLDTGFEKVYIKGLKKTRELALMKPTFDGNAKMPSIRVDVDRVLVLYAYYEKTPQYKENLEYFLKTAVYQDALKGEASLVDYIVVVNGDHTVNFPAWNNLHVMQRNNSCLDFGSWGVAIAQHRAREHAYFFVINASVKGPFLPNWFQSHWSEAFISRLKDDIAAVGLSVNCPDGVGRGVPHIMTMAVMFDRRVMELADQKGLFACVESYRAGLSRESDFSIAIMEAGYNIASMQTDQLGVDFRLLYQDYLADKANTKSGCIGIDKDVFFKEGWYQGMSPNPFEFVFLKVSRDVSTHATDVVGSLVLESSRTIVHQSVQNAESRLHLLLMMHSLDMDGAPRLLFEMGAMLVQMGYKVTFVAFETGALAGHITTAGAELRVVNRTVGGSLQALITGLYDHFDLAIFNTIVWANLIGAQSYNRVPYPKIMWLIHEGELHQNTAIENSAGENFWYGMRYKSIADEASQRNTLQKVDKVVFVADKVRAIWGNYDTGNFETFRGFVSVEDVEKRARAGIAGPSRQALLESVGATEDTFIMTTVGTICKRKNQFLLIKALQTVGSTIFEHRPYILLVIGAPSESGGRGDNAYYQNIKAFVDDAADLRDKIKFIPFSDDALGYLALSNLHMSVSVAEAFPLNVLEAMALGIPVMVTPAGGSEEAFMQPGVDGLLLPHLEYHKHKLQENLKKQLQGKLHILKDIGIAGKKTLLAKYTNVAARSRLKSLIERTLTDKPRGPNGNVCIVVRTFSGHMKDPIFSLRNLLKSLIDQEYEHWTAFVANTDRKPMKGLYSLLADLSDPRLRVVDPPEPVEFVHGSFAVTDRIISEQCPHDTDWLLVTNGDNYYQPTFLNHLDLKKDVVAYDFYSRYNHILDKAVVGDGCRRFFTGGKIACKKNLLKNWHTDLGSYVMNYKRWMVEGRSFVPMDKEQDGCADGYTMESIVYYDWQLKLVDQTEGCLFSHSPNMYNCLNNSFTDSAVWDANRNMCVVDPAAILALHQTHVPYTNPDLPYEMRMFQDRCMERRTVEVVDAVVGP